MTGKSLIAPRCRAPKPACGHRRDRPRLRYRRRVHPRRLRRHAAFRGRPPRTEHDRCPSGRPEHEFAAVAASLDAMDCDRRRVIERIARNLGDDRRKCGDQRWTEKRLATASGVGMKPQRPQQDFGIGWQVQTALAQIALGPCLAWIEAFGPDASGGVGGRFGVVVRFLRFWWLRWRRSVFAPLAMIRPQAASAQRVDNFVLGASA